MGHVVLVEQVPVALLKCENAGTVLPTLVYPMTIAADIKY